MSKERNENRPRRLYNNFWEWSLSKLVKAGYDADYASEEIERAKEVSQIWLEGENDFKRQYLKIVNNAIANRGQGD